MAESTKDLIIEDLQDLIKEYGPITRDFYRNNGAFTESEWTKYFPTFKEFLAAAGGVPSESSETNEFIGDHWNVELKGTRISTLDQLLKYCKVDLEVWEVERFIVNKWEMGYTTGNQENKTASVEPLFQVKATLKKRTDIINARQEIEALKEEAKKYAPIPYPVLRLEPEGGNLLEIVIPDLHAMKLSWHKETGYIDYDIREAEAVYERAVNKIISRVKNTPIDHILLCMGQDLLNSDNLNSTTTKGTLVNTDTRFHKGYVIVRQLLVRTIEKLRRIAPVTVKVIPGNHDTLSTFTLGDSLECWFHNYDDVTVDNSPIQHKFFRWGDVFLMIIHGDKGKKDDYGLWMATEKPQDFGETKFREIHIGHLHKTKLDEKFGIRVRTLSALTPPDAWHAENGFVGNLRSAEGFIWNKQEGLISVVYHNEVD